MKKLLLSLALLAFAMPAQARYYDGGGGGISINFGGGGYDRGYYGKRFYVCYRYRGRGYRKCTKIGRLDRSRGRIYCPRGSKYKRFKYWSSATNFCDGHWGRDRRDGWRGRGRGGPGIDIRF